MVRQVLFICYWGIEDVLTASTVLPWVRKLEQLPAIHQIVLTTMEREGSCNVLTSDKTKHVPLYPKLLGSPLLSKISDFIDLPSQLIKIAKDHTIDLIIAYSSPAGALAHKVCMQTHIPYLVGSFEPHADYMVESGVWSKYGLKYLFQKRWEQKQKLSASGLMPVAESYKYKLWQEEVPREKIMTVPCAVDLMLFQFDKTARIAVRERLGIAPEAIVGIYVGKYGGLYYEQEAFHIYQKCFQFFPAFYLIILSPQEPTAIAQLINKNRLPAERIYTAYVPHKEIPAYLSASDVAFATFKPGLSKIYLSPVKIGEYWANGLPVLLTEGVGDDSNIIKREGGGAVYNLAEEDSLDRALQEIQQMVGDATHRERIPLLAKQYRSFDKVTKALQYFLEAQEHKKQ
ncbi:glycosyltransferase family 4 protein [Pontibacter sp. SGAir0037]|uniref:glycosyltransferase family 4 protein n=1 Tax=Pontibacter sp. SGAir0037 TaxID=2571030 RepID=UPI0010F63D15|nr:glycosyltransferase family 4 protein [Pontibacter sp. SGAir0037]